MPSYPHTEHSRPDMTPGGWIPGTRLPAFSMLMLADAPLPVLIAVPHAGQEYPDALRAAMRNPARDTVRLEDRHVDRIAAAVTRETGAALLVAHAPRALIDLNRSADDVDWSMIRHAPPGMARHSFANRRARHGLGLVPQRLPKSGEIWNRPLAFDALQSRIGQVHAPYHLTLSKALGQIADRWGAALLLDLHSMPPLPVGKKGGGPARYVVGDRFGASADDRLVAAALRHFARDGAHVAHNRPYAGGYVLDRHAMPRRNIHGLQLEICRSLYLDAAHDEVTPDIEAVVGSVTELVRLLGGMIADMGDTQRHLLAAE